MIVLFYFALFYTGTIVLQIDPTELRDLRTVVEGNEGEFMIKNTSNFHPLKKNY